MREYGERTIDTAEPANDSSPQQVRVKSRADGLRIRAALGILLAAVLLLGACANLPDSSAPQALGTIDRAPTSTGPTPPAKGRDPDLLVRDFLTATADPTDRHAAARLYLTPYASSNWDDAAKSVIVNTPDTLLQSRTADTAIFQLHGRKIGELDSDGSYHATDTAFETQITMTKIDNEWRINQLPSGVVVDKTAFGKAYQRYSLYFPNSAGTMMVPDLRWIAARQGQLSQRLLSLLADGPQTELAPAVHTVFGGQVTLRGPITKANGQTDNVGVGLGGIQIDLTDAASLDQHDKELLAAQLVLTLAGADILGPYMLLADGKPLDDRYPTGMAVGDVGALNPMGAGHNQIGLHALRDGGLVSVDTAKGTVVPTPGYFGTVHNWQSVGLSGDGQLVAAVAASGQPAPAPSRTLVIGSYDGTTTFSVAQGNSFTRPSWTADGGAAWTVIDGNRVIRAVHDRATGNVSVQNVDISALTAAQANSADPVPRLPLTDLRISRDGVRAAVIAGGKVFVAVVVPHADGHYSLESAQPVAVDLGAAAVSIDWLTADTLILATDGTANPVQSVFLDGTDLKQVVSQNLTPPVRVVEASPDTLYAADARAVMQVQSTDATADRVWREVQGLGPNAIPVLPG